MVFLLSCEIFPGPRDAGAEQLKVDRANGNMPPVLMRVDPDK